MEGDFALCAKRRWLSARPPQAYRKPQDRGEDLIMEVGSSRILMTPCATLG